MDGIHSPKCGTGPVLRYVGGMSATPDQIALLMDHVALSGDLTPLVAAGALFVGDRVSDQQRYDMMWDAWLQADQVMPGDGADHVAGLLRATGAVCHRT